MLNDTLKLTDEKVLNYAQDLLADHLSLSADGYKCTTADLLKIILGVATETGTVESVCADLVGTPNPETICRYLNEQLQVADIPKLEVQLNAALAAEIPTRVWRQPRQVAMDFHDRPYYGKVPQDEGQWVRGQAKDGTTRFYRVATAYVILKNVRVTLAVRFVLPDDNTVTLVADLLNRLKILRIDVAELFLDRGFAGVAVMQYLTHIQQPGLIACTIRGRTGGTRALCHGPRSYRTAYTFHSPGRAAFTAELAVCRVFTTAKRTGRHPRKATWMIFILIHLDWTPRQARRQYRRRFGIESSYRCAGQVRGWTTSPNPAYRFLLIGLSFVLLNVWVHLRWLFTQVPRRGSRWLQTQLFELSRLAKFIIRALERAYGCVHTITAPTVPRP